MDKKITQVKFEAEDSSWDHTIKITDMDVSDSMEYWADTPYDKALSGALRQNVRGTRVNVVLSFEASTEKSTFRTLKNNIISSASDDYIFFYPDASKTDKLEVVVPKFDYSSVYNKTIGRFVPAIELISYEILSSIPSYLEAP